MTVISIGYIRFANGEIDRLRPHMETQIMATRAEDGCEQYVYAVDALDPNLLHVTERWRDNDAMMAHFTAPHVAQFSAIMKGFTTTGMCIKAYDADGERVLMER